MFIVRGIQKLKKIKNFSSVLKPKLGGSAGIMLHLRLLEIKYPKSLLWVLFLSSEAKHKYMTSFIAYIHFSQISSHVIPQRSVLCG